MVIVLQKQKKVNGYARKLKMQIVLLIYHFCFVKKHYALIMAMGAFFIPVVCVICMYKLLILRVTPRHALQVILLPLRWPLKNLFFGKYN